MNNPQLSEIQNNKHAVTSLTLGLLTIITFCTGMVPIPFTGIICFPVSFIFGALALTYGLVGLNQIRARNESGKPMAWAGIIIGGFVFLCVVCMVAGLASLFFFAPEYVPNVPPFWNGNQL